MLSILIPIFNYDVSTLIRQLIEQESRVKNNIEILCLDDGSSDEYAVINKALSEYAIKYIQLQNNTGRAVARNLLAQKARFPNLLFIDCDSLIYKKDFIKQYCSFIPDYEVICGGRIYDQEKVVSKEKILHHTYGRNRESKPLAIRRKYPDRYFHTNNILIKKDIILKHPFNIQHRHYGYEDLELASTLTNNGIKIQHIENEVIHDGLKQTDTFLQDIKKSMQNLSTMYYANSVTKTPIIKTYNILKKLNCILLFKKTYKKYENRLLSNLHSSKPNMRSLDFYKLYHFMVANEKQLP